MGLHRFLNSYIPGGLARNVAWSDKIFGSQASYPIPGPINYKEMCKTNTGLFGSLCRAPSNRVKGSPFRPVKAIAVDLFPHTMHCELLFFFERVQHSRDKPSEEVQNSTEIPELKLETAGSTEEGDANLPKEEETP